MTRAGATAGGDEYLALCQVVRRQTGLDLSQYRRPQMERRVRSLARRRGFEDLQQYALAVRNDPAERAALLSHVTINVSQLWRNPEQWEVVRDRVLPELPLAGAVRAWSAGCSNGAEPFTMAALFAEHLPRVRPRIVGSDLDDVTLDLARKAHFSEQDMRDVPALYRTRWFERTGADWQPVAALRGAVTFRQEDLTVPPARPETYDLVVCRNVVIYLDVEARRAVHARLAAALRPGGILMVGATERVPGYRELALEHPLPFLYRKL